MATDNNPEIELVLPAIIIDESPDHEHPRERCFSDASMIEAEGEDQGLKLAARSKHHINRQRRNSATVHTCSRCTKGISPFKEKKKVSDDGLMFWHQDCFTCKSCDTSLEDIGYFTLHNEIYCDICMDKKLAIVCDVCKKSILQYSNDEEMFTSVDSQHRYHKGCIPKKLAPKPKNKNSGRRRSMVNMVF